METRKQEVIDTLNKMIELSEPIYYDDINSFYKAIDKNKMFSVEKEMPKLGIASAPFIRGNDGKLVFNHEECGISSFSLIATITDCLCDERLGFCVNGGGLVTKVCWTGHSGHVLKKDDEEK